jgi:hypothetical protein
MVIKACILRNDVADRLARSIDHYSQNQSDAAYEAARYLVALSGNDEVCVHLRTCNRVNPRERGRETCRSQSLNKQTSPCDTL